MSLLNKPLIKIHRLQIKNSLEYSESFITFPWDFSVAFQNKSRAGEFTE